MRRFIAWQNIARYRRLLETELDDARRKMILKLLEEEEVIWADLIDRPVIEPHTQAQIATASAEPSPPMPHRLRE